MHQWSQCGDQNIRRRCVSRLYGTVLHAARSDEFCSYWVNRSHSSAGYLQSTGRKQWSCILTTNWYDVTTSGRSCLHKFPANHHINAGRIHIRITGGVGPSDWIWHAPKFVYSVNIGARRSIGFYTDGSLAEHIGFSADDAEHVNNTADGSEYSIGSAADAFAAVCCVDTTYHSNRSPNIYHGSVRRVNVPYIHPMAQ